MLPGNIRVEDLMLILSSVILVSYFELYINWFDKQISMESLSLMESIYSKTSVVVKISGGLHFIEDCRTEKTLKELLNFKELDGCLITNQKGTYLVFSEPITPNEFCFRVQELYAESYDGFLRFARWFPNCYLSQVYILAIVSLIWAVSRYNAALGTLLFAEFMYALIGLVIRPIGAALILNRTLGVTYSDMHPPWIIILTFGSMATVYFFGLSVSFANQQWPYFGNMLRLGHRNGIARVYVE